LAKTEKVAFIRSKGFLLIVVFFLLILILTFFFGDSGIFEIMKSQKRIEVLEQRIKELEKTKTALQAEIEALKKNPLALEKKAREKLWLMKKNEKVVVIVKDKDKNNKKEK
jgi:cell division protein FtsB